MAVWDTVENKRTDQTNQTLKSLASRVDWNKHRLIISDNGSCKETWDVYKRYKSLIPNVGIIANGENLGTARAVNRAWSFRIKGEHCLKMDNDVVVNESGWADALEEVFRRDPSIGIAGLKRKDLAECPDNIEPHFRSVLKMLPHKPGESWMVVEEVNHVMGTCQSYSSDLLDKIGFLFQGNWKYGYDDSLASLRAHLAGFRTVFIPNINIDHIDPGGTAYTQKKQDDAGLLMNEFNKIVLEYRLGSRSIYYDGGVDGTTVWNLVEI
jgi:GT2 family glycosyltransferase